MHPLTVYVHIRLHYLQVICAVGGCRAVLKYCGNTTNLASHLKSQHLQEFLRAGFGSVVKKPEAVQHKQLQSPGQVKLTDAFNATTKLPHSSKRAKELTDAIGYFIAKDMQPVSVVQGVGFQHMMNHLEPRFQIPHRKTFMDRVLPSLYLKVKETVLPCIAAADCFAITADCWTSRANEAYIGVTFHTITKEWEIQHFVLENQELPEQHTAANIAEAMKNVLAHWKLDSSKLSGATVDNAANIQKAMTDILSWKCLGCFGHTVNLCVKAGLRQRQVETALARCSRLVAFFRKSSRATHILGVKQEALDKPKHKLLQEVDTRWNSTYDMIERVMEQQVPICATLIEMKRMDLIPKDTECRLLEEIWKRQRCDSAGVSRKVCDNLCNSATHSPPHTKGPASGRC